MKKDSTRTENRVRSRMQVENMVPLCVVLKGSIHLATREIRFENLQTSRFIFLRSDVMHVFLHYYIETT